MASDPFRIRDHVGDFDAIVADMKARSEAARTGLRMEADIAYGAGPAETLDLFFPAGARANIPVHVFIHGGYWRMFSKRDYSYVAETVTRAGGIAVVVDYALMPAVRMAAIVDQVRRAKRWVIDHIAEHGGNPDRVTVSGHSAGAHLSTFLFNEMETPSAIRGALLLGGLYELKPLQSSFLREEIGITDAEVAAFSPATHTHDRSTAVSILVGAEETAPFHQQADRFASQLRGQRVAVSRADLVGSNHMSSVRDLGIAGSAAARHLAALIESR
ncbi:arylformamidase [Kaistia soli DSM 19436]|uniref:Arylformamidase n=1 Tax=Kaistia soli DSM 19436 TaxID=1122133 RepID=A0A1M4WNM3_9HYPH|nr:alpha/beta hydrolase [Kaistia soli]SHE82808.1 arylformamidase [Kaistia soli DSM 19436]